jgi:Protein of unknown function (DUF3105)
MMASGKTAKKQRRAAPVMTQREGLPWLTITAVAIIVALAATVFFVVYGAKQDKDEAAAAEAAISESLKPWEPTADNPDPSTVIPGIYVGAADAYKVGLHVSPPTRVAYDRFPPVGGPHDAEWAACNGVVYAVGVRNENMVHTLEHGAVWITYNPDTISASDLDLLTSLVDGQPYTSLSPYPGLDSPIALQAWAHQLKVDSASDERVTQFLTALRQNRWVYPETGATCQQPTFDVDNPPAFDPTTPGADAIPMSGAGAQVASTEMSVASSDESVDATASQPVTTAEQPVTTPATPSAG